LILKSWYDHLFYAKNFFKKLSGMKCCIIVQLESNKLGNKNQEKLLEICNRSVINLIVIHKY